MTDEIISEPVPTQTEPQTASQLEPTPVQPENPISEPSPAPVSPQEPTEQTPIPPIESTTVPVPPEPVEASPNPEESTPVKDANFANEPLEQPSETAQTPQEPPITETNPKQNPALETPQNSPETVKEQPTAQPKTETAQLPPNEPIDLAEEIKTKKREENLKLANETRQEKKRKKIDEILNLFAERQTVNNDEVEKLLHVSDATATRYLETLEKEGKIKQIGKTGKSVRYEKI